MHLMKGETKWAQVIFFIWDLSVKVSDILKLWELQAF